MKIFSVAQMVAAEKAADAAGVTYDQMMENAGKAIADAILARWPADGTRVLVLVGPGNNGGDGLVAGRYLADAGADVAFCLSHPRDPEEDDNFAQIRQMGLLAIEAGFDQRYRVLRTRLRITDILIDGLLGTGVSRPIEGKLANLMQQVAAGLAARRADLEAEAKPTLQSIAATQTAKPAAPIIVAVDCPSGLNCDTGALDPLALPADLTVTFAGPKLGHFKFPGAAACGELVVADIKIPPDLPAVQDVTVELATAVSAHTLLPDRPIDGHKGTFGKLLIAAGCDQYRGAPVLAAKGAFRAGAGLVALAVPEVVRATAVVALPEATYIPVADEQSLTDQAAQTILAGLDRHDALLIGPGLGQAAMPFLETMLAADALPPLILDADGLNLLAQMDAWPQTVPPHTILTPHPGEMARLMAVSFTELQAQDRIDVARDRAMAWGHVVLLKGAYTVVAGPDGRVTLLPFAQPALAVGGSGDVLSGVIGTLLAQELAPYDAAVLGGWLHGAAGALHDARSGLLAGEIADQVAEAINCLRNGRAPSGSLTA